MQWFKAERCNQIEIYSPELIKNTFGRDNTRRGKSFIFIMLQDI